ncbi:hypothetical protein SAMN05892877_11521 [Rhizobium subbaraonis]|uniref:Uncharacterized protein n=1 Tax=Rhizobium subbaraonis TaxID=908946 RepID=A0A285UYJ8_9HYPH|nr:hypothetical protein SAMN05892877_11521 [Rhizobium subbaraonis]
MTFSLLLFACAAEAGDAQPFVTAADPAIACHEEEVLLSIWHAQKMLSSVDYSGETATIVVSSRHWLKTRADVQMQIAFAAYCRVAVKYGRGKVEVTGYNGHPLYGTVVDGRWHNRLTGG